MLNLRDLAVAYDGEVLFEVHEEDGSILTVIASNTAETLKDEVLDREVEKYKYVGNMLTQSVIVSLKGIVDEPQDPTDPDPTDPPTDPDTNDPSTDPSDPPAGNDTTNDGTDPTQP